MTISIGTDILEMSRLKAVLERHGERFIRRLLTADERQEYQHRQQSLKFLANRYAGKEAVAKALGTGIAAGISFQSIEILPNRLGAPEVRLLLAAKERLQAIGGQRVLLSLSDERRYVVAFALVS